MSEVKSFVLQAKEATDCGDSGKDVADILLAGTQQMTNDLANVVRKYNPADSGMLLFALKTVLASVDRLASDRDRILESMLRRNFGVIDASFVGGGARHE